MEVVKRFKKNLVGNDYVVGDIHGCYSKLQTELNKLGFDEVNDRLFSVGDLVDRGPESEEFYKWLDKPWFHAVRGNHDQMVVDASECGAESSEAWNHVMNGGVWFNGLPTVEQQCYAIMMKELPIAIEVETDNGLIGIIHAECPLGDWDLFKSLFADNEHYFSQVAMWARSKISSANTSYIAGLHKLYCGHTVVDDVVCLGNVEYIDTGACFLGGKFTIKKIN